MKKKQHTPVDVAHINLSKNYYGSLRCHLIEKAASQIIFELNYENETARKSETKTRWISCLKGPAFSLTNQQYNWLHK